MKKIITIIILMTVLGLVGCGNGISKNTDTIASKTKVVNSKNKNKVKQEGNKQEYKTKIDNIKIGLKDLDNRYGRGCY